MNYKELPQTWNVGVALPAKVMDNSYVTEAFAVEESGRIVKKKKAMIIIDHGSKRAEANRMLEEVVKLVRSKSNHEYPIIEPAHMELAEPSLATAFRRCVEQGANEVVVSLFFLSPGRHSRQDIPRMVAEAASAYPGLKFSISDPIGLDGRLAEILLDRAHQARDTS